ncbi:MAG: ROK family glucokinase [Hungatella sp.]|nr:ROK family glucokinase [Hungatella sp.]
MKSYGIGVDIGGTTVKIGVFESDGTLVKTWEIPTRTEDEGSHILGDIALSVKEKLKEEEISLEEVKGIGMGVPGPVTEEGLVLKCVNLGWGVFHAAKVMSDLVGLPVKVGNDANVAALGEMWQGGGKGCDSLVLLTLGTGVGAGIVLNQRILTGCSGAAGEVGHMHVNLTETESCSCGNKGCLEQYTSATGVVRLMKRYFASHQEADSLVNRNKAFSAKDVFDAAREGDKAALCVVEEFGEYLGNALAALACVVNPEAFVIGGGMAAAGDILMDIVEKNYRNYAFHAVKDAKVLRATLGNMAGIYGGAKMALSE